MSAGLGGAGDILRCRRRGEEHPRDDERVAAVERDAFEVQRACCRRRRRDWRRWRRTQGCFRRREGGRERAVFDRFPSIGVSAHAHFAVGVFARSAFETVGDARERVVGEIDVEQFDHPRRRAGALTYAGEPSGNVVRSVVNATSVPSGEIPRSTMGAVSARSSAFAAGELGQGGERLITRESVMHVDDIEIARRFAQLNSEVFSSGQQWRGRQERHRHAVCAQLRHGVTRPARPNPWIGGVRRDERALAGVRRARAVRAGRSRRLRRRPGWPGPSRP